MLPTLHSHGIVLLSAFLMLVTVLAPLPADALQAKKVGTVGALQGQAVARNGAQGKDRALAVGGAIYMNDTISTQKSAKVQLMFLDRSTLTVNADSVVTIDTFVYNPAESTGDMTLRGAKGAFRFIGGVLSKKKPVTIKTPVSTIGIRGGIADTHISPTGATDAIFVYGEELTMESPEGGRQSITQTGTGLTVTTVHSTPRPLPPAAVSRRLAVFDAPPATGNSQPGGSGQQQKEGANAGAPTAPGAATNANGQEGSGENGSADAAPDTGKKRKQGHPPLAGQENGDKNGDGSTEASGPQSENGNRRQNTMRTPGKGPYAENNHHEAQAGQPREGGHIMPLPPVSPLSPSEPFTGGDAFGGEHTFSGEPVFIHPPIDHFVPPVETNTATASATRDTSIGNFDAALPPPDTFGLYASRTAGATATFSEGKAEFSKDGDRFRGSFIQGEPFSAGPAFIANLANPSAPGFRTFTDADNILIDGSRYTGHGYRNPAGSMHYYYLDQIDGDREIGTLIGTRIAPSAWEQAALSSWQNAGTTNGIAFYDFLPDLVEYSATGNPLGFLHYNIKNPALLPSGSTVPNPETLGLAVDWGHRRFLTGYLDWENGGNAGHRRDLTLAFGSVNTASDDPLFSGYAFQMGDAGGAPSLANVKVATGDIKVNEHVYGVNGSGPVDGFVLEGQEHHGAGRLLQPVMRSPERPNQVEAAASRPTEQLRGFAGGYMVLDDRQTAAGSTNNPYAGAKRYLNTHPNGVVITKDAQTGDINATIAVFEADNGSGPTIDAHFGRDASDNVAGVYISDKLYAVQQGKVVYNAGSTENKLIVTGADAQKGVLVSGGAIANVTQCTRCEFAEWGAWAAEITKPPSTEGASPTVDVANLIPFVAGPVTENLAANVSPQGLGNVTYQGPMYGAVRDAAGAVNRAQGNFAAQINLDTRTLNDFTANIAAMHFGTAVGTSHAIQGHGDAVFSNIPVVNKPITGGNANSGNISGQINGALFGPNAEDIGGSFAVKEVSTGKNAAGVYIGTRK